MRTRSHLPGSLTAWLTCLLAACSLASAVAAPPDFSERELLTDAADGRLDHFPLLDAAIIAGGIRKDSERVSALKRLDARWLEVGEPLIEQLAPADRPRAIFSATHRLLLTGKYHAECTEVQRTLLSGDYNCVTATVLYLELCRKHGLQGCAVAIPGHVYCRLSGNDNIQTTCRDWFEVREGRASSATAQAIKEHLAASAVQPRELTDVQLLGKVYYNRGVSCLEDQDFAGAIALLKTSLLLDPEDAPARNNLLAAHNNWALALCDAGDHAGAAAKLTLGREIDSQYGPLKTNDLYVHQKWVLHLCDRGRYSAAIELLEQGYQRQPEAALFNGGRFAVYGMWMRTLLESNRLKEALTVLESAQQRYGRHDELVQQEIEAFAAAIKRLQSKGDQAASQNLLLAALARHPDAEVLKELQAE